MALIRIISIWLLLAGLPLAGFCAQQELREAPAGAETKAEKKEEHGIPQKATEIARIKTPIGDLAITNSMVVTWIVAIGLIVFAQIATRNMKEVPDGAQNFWEWLVEGLYTFLEGIIGRELVHKTFWFFASIFIFILFCNWLGLVPGFGTIGWGTSGRV